MSNTQTPEQQAEELVAVETNVVGGPYFVRLKHFLNPPVSLGPYSNRDIAKADATLIRSYLVAMIRDARQGASSPPGSGDVVPPS
jgi:hypothetical protein